jgi:hypothetical protein
VAKQPLSGDQIVALHAAVQQFEAWLAALDQGAQAEGFITAVHTAASKAQQQQQQQQQDKAAGSAGGKDGLVYQEYNPLLLQGGKLGGEVITFPSFDDALDEYYGKVSTVASHQVVEHSDFSRERRGHVINDTPGGGGYYSWKPSPPNGTCSHTEKQCTAAAVAHCPGGRHAVSRKCGLIIVVGTPLAALRSQVRRYAHD